jgi:hypothetical protein
MRRWVIALAVATALPGCTAEPEVSAVPTPTPAPLFVAEHLGQTSSAAMESCVEMPASTMKGRAALERAWGRATIKTSPSGAICAIGGVNACDGKGKWRHYIIGEGAVQRRAPSDPDEYTVRAGELDAWLYNPPGDTYSTIAITFGEVCEDALAGSSS